MSFYVGLVHVYLAMCLSALYTSSDSVTYLFCSALNVMVYTATFLSIGGFLAALEFQTDFYVLYPIVAIVGLVCTCPGNCPD